MNDPAWRRRVGAHAPTNSAGRLSTNAVRPSAASLDPNSISICSRFEREPIVERPLAALVHATLDRSDRHRAPAASSRRRTRASSRRGPSNTCATRPSRAPPRARAAPGDQELHSPRRPDQPGQPLGAAVARQEPQLHLGRPQEVLVLLGHADVAGQRDLQSAPERVPGDVGDEQLLALAIRRNAVLAESGSSPCWPRRPLGEEALMSAPAEKNFGLARARSPRAPPQTRSPSRPPGELGHERHVVRVGGRVVERDGPSAPSGVGDRHQASPPTTTDLSST